MKEILIVCASSGRNLMLAEKIRDVLANDFQLSAQIIDLEKADFKMYSPKTAQIELSPTQQKLLTDVVGTQNFVFVSPEYNGGMAPLLSNFFCWASKRSGENWRKVFDAKLAALATVSGSNGHLLLS